MFRSQIFSLAAAAASFVALTAPASASAHHRPFPLVMCGPQSAYLCKLHGSFADAPFHYNLAIYPGCIRAANSGRRGAGREWVVVCGSADRQMVWW